MAPLAVSRKLFKSEKIQYKDREMRFLPQRKVADTFSSLSLKNDKAFLWGWSVDIGEEGWIK